MGIRSLLVLYHFLILSLDGQSLDNFPDNFLVFVDSSNVSIYRMDISNYSYASISLQNVSNPVAIDYDPIDGVIFWTDVGLHRILSASVYGNNQTTIRSLSIIAVTDGIAVDALSRLLFYTDTGNDIIAALSFDGSIQKTLINSSLYEPRAIVADPIIGTIYWTDWGNISKIEKANYDGTNRQEVISTGLVWPNGLAVDIQAAVMYWCDAGTEKIERANVDGSQRQVIYQAQPPAHFFGITLYKSYLYYTDWERRSVMRIRTNGIEQSSVGVSAFGKLNGIRAHTNGTGIQGINMCSNGRGGCSHFCFPQPGGTKQCACPDGMTLQADGQTCKANNLPDNFFLISDISNRIIYRMDIHSYSYASIPVQQIMTPVAIDYDPIDGVIYWTDVGLRQILSASIYGHSQTTIRHLNSVAVPDGIAVDAISRLLFYTDTGNDIIAALSFDSSIRKTIINSSLDEPRAIVADPFNGTIFWTDWGNISKIEKSNYDGTNRQELIKTGLMWPNGLAVDIIAGVMYWCDGGTAKIERANVDGTNRQIIYQAQQGTHFFGIALYQSYIYLTGWTQSAVMRIYTNGSGPISVGPAQSFRLSGIHVDKDGHSPTGINGCSNGRGGCSHFCFPQPGGSKMCACSDGMVLQFDGQTCGTYLDECFKSPCKNGGNCTSTNDTYSCNCPLGWQGKNCSEDVNECLNSPCEHGGNCSSNNGTDTHASVH